MILLVIKGIIIGFFMLFPGLSGGSIAIMLSEYNSIIYHTANVLSNPKKSLVYLFLVGCGGIIGLYFSSQIISFLTMNFYIQMVFFFLGIMCLFIVNFIKGNINEILRFNQLFLIFVGVMISILFNYIPSGYVSLGNVFSLFVLGIILAIALILPGISVSYVLLIFSCYDDVINAISNFDFLFLLKMGFFLVVGIIITVKFLQNYISKEPIKTNLLISGFMIGSFITFIPMPKTVIELNSAVIFFMLGILFFLIFGKIVRK